MKQLLIIRHAKSSWDHSIQNDFDRPLNERGQRDSLMMANRLLTKNVSIDAFISSTAKRAITTATNFYNAYNKNGNTTAGLIEVPDLYHAPPKVFEKVILAQDDKCESIAIFAHNPGITEFANQLTTIHIDDMPTCAIYAIKIQTSKWCDFVIAKKSFWFFDYPKSI